MYAHGFLCGVAVALLAMTVALLIGEAVLKRKIRQLEKDCCITRGDVIRTKSDAQLADMMIEIGDATVRAISEKLGEEVGLDLFMDFEDARKELTEYLGQEAEG